MSEDEVSLSHQEVRSLLGLTAEPVEQGTVEGRLTRVSTAGHADRKSVVFATSEEALRAALQSEAGLVLATEELRHTGQGDRRVVWTQDARVAFALVARRLQPVREISEIAETAVVDATAVLGERVVVGAGAVLEAGVVVGDECVLGPRVVVHAGTVLGRRVVAQAGVVLGSTGFGYVKDPATGEHVLFPQQGRLVIEDDVQIGANCTIDRGALGETRIGRGTKIDNLVHIAHNCQIGRDVLIAAQTGIAGSSRIADRAVIAGQVGIADHVEIGPEVVLGAKCGVPSGKRLSGPGQLFWGIPARPIQEYLRELARLRRL